MRFDPMTTIRTIAITVIIVMIPAVAVIVAVGFSMRCLKTTIAATTGFDAYDQ
jgi:hypothetical protein